MNTKISYLYCDASNYKKDNTAVIEGELSPEQQKKILSCLDEELFFIPELVGLPEERFDAWTEDDHDWFELCDEDFSLTNDEPSVDITAEELVKRFEAASALDWDKVKFERYMEEGLLQ